jgi:KilA-N domain
MLTSFISKDYEGRHIRIDPNTHYPCLTDICNAIGKNVADFLRLQSTTDYISALSCAMGIPIEKLLLVGKSSLGTWAHPQLAIKCAGWCSPKLEVVMTSWIYELLTTGRVELVATPTPLAFIATNDIERTSNIGHSLASRGYPVDNSKKIAPPDGWLTVAEYLQKITGDYDIAKTSGASHGICSEIATLYRANTRQEPLKKGGSYCYPPEYFAPIQSHYDAWAKEHIKVLEVIKLKSATRHKQCDLFDQSTISKQLDP